MRQQSITKLSVAGICFSIVVSSFITIPSARSASPNYSNDLGLFTTIFQPEQSVPYLPPAFESSSFPDTFSTGKVNATDPDPSPLPTTIPSPTSPQPTIQIKQSNSPANQDLTKLFEQYGKEFGVDPDKLARIAHCESTYNSGAVNGPYGGMYQFHPNTWTNDRKKRGWDPDPNLRFDARESIRTAAAKISAGGLGAWPVCGFK